MVFRWVLIGAGCALFACRPVERGFDEASDPAAPDDASSATPTDVGAEPEAADGGADRTDPEPAGPSALEEPESNPAEPEGTPAEPEASGDPQPEPSASEPQPIATEPEPTATEPEPTPAEPEPSATDPEPSPAEPQPTPVEPEPTAVEPEPTAVEPEPTAVEPEPTATEPEMLPEESEPIGGCGEQLLRNGSFDVGGPAWTESSTFPGIEVIVGADSTALAQQGVSPRSGDSLAWLGGIPDNEFDSHIVRIVQQVAVPEGTTGLTFSGFVWIRSEETDPAVAYDATYVDLTTLDENLLWHVHAFTNLEHEEAWVGFEYTADEVPFAGTEVILEIHSETDPELVSSFWFDDLRLVATCLR